MRSLAVVDSGPLLASLDRLDAHHARSLEVLRRADFQLVVPALVVAEVAYFGQKRLGSRAEAAFVRALSGMDVEPPLIEEWPIIADLIEQYADFPLGAVDASIVVLADRFDTDLVITLDVRHFAAIRSPRGRRFTLLPEQPAVHEEPATYQPEPA